MKRPDNLPRRIAAVLFDFDETMINLEAQHDTAHRALCRAMGADYGDMPESFRFGSGRRIVDDIAEMRAFFGWGAPQNELYDLRHRHFLAACRDSDLALMPGVERVVRDLHDGGLRLAITSSAAGDAIDEILRRFGLRDCFETIVDGSDVDRGKPDPQAYLVTARMLAVDPHECVVMEDSEIGVAAAKAAGMYCIAIRNAAARTVQDLSGADLELDTLEQLDPAWLTASRASR